MKNVKYLNLNRKSHSGEWLAFSPLILSTYLGAIIVFGLSSFLLSSSERKSLNASTAFLWHSSKNFSAAFGSSAEWNSFLPISSINRAWYPFIKDCSLAAFELISSMRCIRWRISASSTRKVAFFWDTKYSLFGGLFERDYLG